MRLRYRTIPTHWDRMTSCVPMWILSLHSIHRWSKAVRTGSRLRQNARTANSKGRYSKSRANYTLQGP